MYNAEIDTLIGATNTDLDTPFDAYKADTHDAVIMTDTQLVVTGGPLFTATDESIVEDGAVLVDGERIVAAGPRESVQPTGDVEEIDVEGRTIMPGLVDAHIHVTYTTETAGTEFRFFDPKDSLEYNAIKATTNAKTYLDHGVTAARDIGSRRYIASAVRDAIDDGLVPGPRLKASGPFICSTAGILDMYPNWINAETEFIDRVDGVDEVIKATRRQLKGGVDNVKIEASGEWLSPFASPTTETMSEAEIAAAVRTAHDHDVQAAVVSRTAEGAKRGVRAGADTLEHGTEVDDELLSLLVESNTYYVPTLVQIKLYAERGADEGMTDDQLAKLQSGLDAQVESIRRAHEAGVTVVAGTDSLPPYVEHGKTALELSGFVTEAGFDPIDALLAGTKHAAEAIGFGDETGTIEAGNYADLLVVDGNPTEDIHVLESPENIAAICKGGSFVKNSLSETP